MSNKIVLGIGEFLFDVLPGGKKAGGAPVNFAFHASKHGVRSYAISAIGDDVLGEELLDAASSNGIKVIAPKTEYPTSTVQVEVDGNGVPNFTICEGVAWDHIPLTAEMADLASRADAICYGTLSQRCPDSRRTIAQLIAMAKPGALKVYDINLRQKYYSKELISENLKLADVLKLNDDEFVIVCGMFNLDISKIEDSCRWLMKEFDLKTLILTAGAVDSSIFSSDGTTSILPTPKVNVIDSVGAGDSFTGAYIASVLNGSGIRQAHEIAVQAAAEVCMKAGAWV